MTSVYMGSDYFQMRLNSDRELAIERAREALGATSDTEAVVRALEHLVQSIEAYEAIKDELTPEQADILSTEHVSINHYPQVRT